MKVITKKQLLLGVISLFLICLGVFSLSRGQSPVTIAVQNENTENRSGDVQLVSSNNVEDEENLISEECIETVDEDYFSESKMERDNIYSGTLEVYENMLNSNTVTNEQKAIAQSEIQKLTKSQNSILISENLLKIKGFEDCIIFENEGSISVIVKIEELLPEHVAQIQNIVSREFGIGTENINITNK